MALGRTSCSAGDGSTSRVRCCWWALARRWCRPPNTGPCRARFANCNGLLGKTTLENEILRAALDLAQPKKLLRSPSPSRDDASATAGGDRSGDDEGAGRREGRADSGPAGLSLELLRPDPDHAGWQAGAAGSARSGRAVLDRAVRVVPALGAGSWLRRWGRCTCKGFRRGK